MPRKKSIEAKELKGPLDENNKDIGFSQDRNFDEYTETTRLLQIQGIETDVAQMEPISFYNAELSFLKFSKYYVISRVTLALPWFFNGIVIKSLGQDDILASPNIMSIQACIMGASSAFVSPIGFLGGAYDTLANELLKQNQNEQAQQKWKKIGRLSRQTWLIAIPLWLSVSTPLFFISPILEKTQPKLPQETREIIQSYFRYYLWSILPSLWMNSDKQLCVTIKRSNAVAVSTISSAITSVVIGYPLALCTDLGIRGLAIGNVVSSWINCVLLRTYLIRAEHMQKYGLLNFRDEKPLKNIAKVLAHGAKMCLFSLGEWGNLLAIAILASRASDADLEATQVAFQLVIPYSFAALAFSQTAASLVGRYRGKRDYLKEDAISQVYQVQQKNIQTIGYASLFTESILGLTTAATVSISANSFSNLFSDDVLSTGDNQDLIVAVLRINCICIFFDSIRMASAGNLRGLKDTLFVPLSSIFIISILGLAISASIIFTQDDSEAALWLFGIRAIMMLIASLLISARWFNQSSTDTNVDKESIDDTKNGIQEEAVSPQETMMSNTSWCRWFCPSTKKNNRDNQQQNYSGRRMVHDT